MKENIHHYRIHKCRFFDDNQQNEVNKKIKEVLNDERGWNKYNHKFIEVYDSTPSNNNKVLDIYFLPDKELTEELGPDIKGLSAYMPFKHCIYFNINNWNGESACTLDLDKYKTYVINHEVGHAIGLDHPTDDTKNNLCCNNGKGSVMMQMTRGPDFIAPCQQNEWPLDPDYFHEFNEGKKLMSIKGGGNVSTNNTVLMFILLTLGLIYMIHICCRIHSFFLHSYGNTSGHQSSCGCKSLHLYR